MRFTIKMKSSTTDEIVTVHRDLTDCGEFFDRMNYMHDHGMNVFGWECYEDSLTVYLAQE